MVRLFVFLLSLFALPGALAQPQRLALVIGNDSYSAVSPLVNARADANAIAQALTRSGFKVTAAHKRRPQRLQASAAHLQGTVARRR